MVGGGPRLARPGVVQGWLIRCRTGLNSSTGLSLIHNPMNRRDPLTLAESMRGELDRRLPDVPAALQATQHAGHARELASSAAATGRPLIVAVSGGVYNEVLNGVLECPATRH
jgi:diacylglycerol kinase (ATP)